MTEEVWREHPYHKGLMASSLGRFKLPDLEHRECKPRKGSVTWAKKGAKHQYYGARTRKYGNLKVHRVVCEAFHGEEPFEGAVVMHLDGDSLNNKADNLAWGTQKENLNHPTFIAYCKGRVGWDSPVKKGKRLEKIRESIGTYA